MERGQRIGLIGAAILVAVVAFIVLSPGDDEDDSTPARTETKEQRQQRGEPIATVDRPEPPRYETIRITGGEPQGGRQNITVEKGDVARFQVKSDTPDDIHLHGYDISRSVAPGKPARFRVKADIEGAFEIEAHDLGHLIVGSLVVEP